LTSVQHPAFSTNKTKHNSNQEQHEKPAQQYNKTSNIYTNYIPQRTLN